MLQGRLKQLPVRSVKTGMWKGVTRKYLWSLKVGLGLREWCEERNSLLMLAIRFLLQLI